MLPKKVLHSTTVENQDIRGNCFLSYPDISFFEVSLPESFGMRVDADAELRLNQYRAHIR